MLSQLIKPENDWKVSNKKYIIEYHSNKYHYFYILKHLFDDKSVIVYFWHNDTLKTIHQKSSDMFHDLQLIFFPDDSFNNHVWENNVFKIGFSFNNDLDLKRLTLTQIGLDYKC